MDLTVRCEQEQWRSCHCPVAYWFYRITYHTKNNLAASLPLLSAKLFTSPHPRNGEVDKFLWSGSQWERLGIVSNTMITRMWRQYRSKQNFVWVLSTTVLITPPSRKINTYSYVCLFIIRCWTTRTCGGDFAPATISRRRVLSPSYAQCRWGWTRAGIKFSSTCQTLRDAPTVPITWKHSEYKYTRIVGFGASTSVIDCIQRTSYRLSLNCSCQSRSRSQQRPLCHSNKPIRDKDKILHNRTRNTDLP